MCTLHHSDQTDSGLPKGLVEFSFFAHSEHFLIFRIFWILVNLYSVTHLYCNIKDLVDLQCTVLDFSNYFHEEVHYRITHKIWDILHILRHKTCLCKLTMVSLVMNIFYCKSECFKTYLFLVTSKIWDILHILRHKTSKIRTILKWSCSQK